jgi:hypothetical protein
MLAGEDVNPLRLEALGLQLGEEHLLEVLRGPRSPTRIERAL